MRLPGNFTLFCLLSGLPLSRGGSIHHCAALMALSAGCGRALCGTGDMLRFFWKLPV